MFYRLIIHFTDNNDIFTSKSKINLVCLSQLEMYG